MTGGTWLVTGAARGIGRALVAAQLARGGRVVATFRSQTPPEPLTALQARHGATLHLLHFDLRETPTPEAAALPAAFRPLEVLLCNGGIYGPRAPDFRGLDPAAVLETLDVNAVGLLRTLDAFQPQMAGAARPRIVALSSLLGTRAKAGANDIAYRMSKAALNAALWSVAAALAPEGVAVAALRPGHVRTDMGGPRGALSPEDSAALLLAVIDGMTPDPAPLFLDTDGSTLYW